MKLVRHLSALWKIQNQNMSKPVQIFDIKKLRVLSWQVLASLTNIRQVKEGENYTLLFLTPNLKWQKFLAQGWGLVFTCREHSDNVYNLTYYWWLLKLKLNVLWWTTMCNQKVEIGYKYRYIFILTFLSRTCTLEVY